MKPRTHTPFVCVALTGSLLGLTGCSSVVRENIFSVVNSGVGVQLAQNPQTQSYEVKAGFLRSQFYSIPTAKDTSNTNRVSSSTNNIGSPQLVSGIHVDANTGFRVFGLNVSESYAVGDIAVNSLAAVAMYMANSKSTNPGASIAEAIKAMHLQSQTTTLVQTTIRTNTANTNVVVIEERTQVTNTVNRIAGQ